MNRGLKGSTLKEWGSEYGTIITRNFGFYQASRRHQHDWWFFAPSGQRSPLSGAKESSTGKQQAFRIYTENDWDQIELLKKKGHGFDPWPIDYEFFISKSWK